MYLQKTKGPYPNIFFFRKEGGREIKTIYNIISFNVIYIFLFNLSVVIITVV